MADNVDITAGTGTTIATDEVTGVHYQKVKVALGLADAEDCLVDSGQQLMAASVPVVLASDQSDIKITLDSEAVVLGAGSAAIGKLAANDGIDIGNVDIASIAAGDNNIGNVDIASIAAGDANIGNVDIVTLPADVAHADDGVFTPATSKVIGSGLMLDDTSTDKVDEGDVGIARMTADRKAIVQVGAGSGDFVSGTGNTTGTGDISVIAGAGSGWFLYISALCGYNASVTDTYVNIKDGTTTKLVLPLPAKGGFTLAFPTPLRLSDNAALQFACPGGVTTSYVSAVGYKANC